MTDPVMPTSPTAATATVPNRAGPNFSAEIYAWFNWQVTNVSEMDALADATYTNAIVGQEQAAAAAQSALDATSNGAAQVAIAAAHASNAADASAAASAAAGFVGDWSALTGALAMPASVKHSGSIWLLAQNLADVTAHEPGVSAAWVASAASTTLTISNLISMG